MGFLVLRGPGRGVTQNAEIPGMEQGAPQHRPAERWVVGKVQTKGLRPRYAAYLIASVWLVAVVVFGVVEHLVDRDTYPNVWLGMWWALQTVTTVGYGDVVPATTAGKVIASFLLLGGLSLIAVITGVVTSAFVTQAQEAKRASGDDPVIGRLDDLAEALAAVQADLARIPRDDARGQPDG
jgi:voltage-gated potassium channel